MPRKRILLLIKGLGRGGAEQLLASAISYRDRDRFEYEVAYLLPWKDALVAELRKADIPVHCLDGARGAGWVRRLRRLIDQRAIDLIHSHSPTAAVAARVIAPPRVRRVYTEHNLWERYHPLTRWANVLTFFRSDHVFAVSDHVRDSIGYPMTLRGLRMPPVETLYHGIDPMAVARLVGGRRRAGRAGHRSRRAGRRNGGELQVAQAAGPDARRGGSGPAPAADGALRHGGHGTAGRRDPSLGARARSRSRRSCSPGSGTTRPAWHQRSTSSRCRRSSKVSRSRSIEALALGDPGGRHRRGWDAGGRQ